MFEFFNEGIGKVIGESLVNTGVGLLGYKMQEKAQDKKRKQELEQAELDALYQLEMEKLKDQYGLNGGGGGGGGGGVDSTGRLIDAYNTYIQNSQRSRAGVSDAYKTLMGSYQAGLL